MTAKEQQLIQRLRREIGDTEVPYRFTDEDLLSLLNEAIADYSKYQPCQRRGKLSLVPGTKEYQLPDDYQTWTKGLEGYDILGRALFLSSDPLSPSQITFDYLADHTLDTIPVREQSLLLDYSMWKLLDSIVTEGAEISGLKLGKGLDIKFANFDQISTMAKLRQERYMNLVSKPIGMWC